jgi:hypothetical protein
LSDINRPTEQTVFALIEAVERLRKQIYAEPPLTGQDWNILHKERRDPDCVFAVAKALGLPLTYVQRRLGLFTAIFWLEEMTR